MLGYCQSSLRDNGDWVVRRRGRKCGLGVGRGVLTAPPPGDNQTSRRHLRLQGLLILGLPGTGKSLTAKATAAVFNVPLLKLDAGKLYGGLVGQSEANLRSVIQTAEAIAPCCLWIDELEKGFAGSKSSGQTD